MPDTLRQIWDERKGVSGRAGDFPVQNAAGGRVNIMCLGARYRVCNGSVMRADDYFPRRARHYRSVSGRARGRALLPGDKFTSDSKAFSGKSLAPIALMSLYLHYAGGWFLAAAKIPCRDMTRTNRAEINAPNRGPRYIAALTNCPFSQQYIPGGLFYSGGSRICIRQSIFHFVLLNRKCVPFVCARARACVSEKLY